MKLRDQREIADAAARNLTRRKRLYRKSKAVLATDIGAWEPALIVGGGLVAGALMGGLRVARMARVALSAVSVVTTVLRTSIGSMALAAMLERHRSPSEAGTHRITPDHGSKPSE